MTRAEMLAAVVVVRDTLKQTTCSISPAHLLAQLDGMERQLIDGEVPVDEWEDFRLQMNAFTGELTGSIWRRTAHLLLAIEEMERKDPQVFAHDEKAQELLRWWRGEGGRERLLGSIPLGERRALEEMARRWREKNP